jgi:hypothetical protein
MQIQTANLHELDAWNFKSHILQNVFAGKMIIGPAALTTP